MIHPLRQGCWDGLPAIISPEFSSPCFAHKIFRGRFLVLTDDLGYRLVKQLQTGKVLYSNDH